jgi:hypothetical protein
VEIVRANITLKRMMSNGSPQHILNEYVSLLQVSRRGAAVLVHCLHRALQVDKAAADQQARCLVVQVSAYCGVWFLCQGAGQARGNRVLSYCSTVLRVFILLLMQFHVTTYMDNSIPGVNSATQRSGRPIKSISQVGRRKEVSL